MWRNSLMRQSGNLKVVGLSPASGKKLVDGGTFSGQYYERFVTLATHFTTPSLNWVPGNCGLYTCE